MNFYPQILQENLLIEYGAARFLLTGDLEIAGERRLLASAPPPRVDILKLGHHGSRSSTSEEWLAALRPQAALVSAGRRNRFNHPSPAVLRRLQTHNIPTWRTDRLGTLWLRTDGHAINIYRFAGP